MTRESMHPACTPYYNNVTYLNSARHYFFTIQYILSAIVLYIPKILDYPWVMAE